MKRMLYSLLLATLPFGSVIADAPKSKNAKVTLVYQHELPNVPGKSIKGVLVEYGRAFFILRQIVRSADTTPSFYHFVATDWQAAAAADYGKAFP